MDIKDNSLPPPSPPPNADINKEGDGLQLKLSIGEVTTSHVEIPSHRKRQKRRLNVASRKSSKIYVCDVCQVSFSRETQLKYHSKMHHTNQDEVHKCEECHTVFFKLSKLIRHRQKKHFMSLKCDKCDSQFSLLSSWKLHKKLHSGERPFCCNECGLTFIQSSHLNIHKRSHTGEKPYQCDVCKQAFKQISHLRSHEMIHSQTKLFVCEFCGNSFIQKSSLTRHMRRHTGEKPYACNVCGTTFRVKNNLNRHMILHTGKPALSCLLCKATFSHISDLKKHRLTHVGSKRFKCKDCKASFSRNINLMLHKYKHTGEPPFQCDKCPSKFMKPRDLQRHKVSHNPSKSKNSLKRHVVKYPALKFTETSNNYSIKDSSNSIEGLSEQKTSSPERPDEVAKNTIPSQPVTLDSENSLPQQYLAYQVQVHEPSSPSVASYNIYNRQDLQQPSLTYTASSIGLPAIQPIVQAQMPTLMIPAGSGQQARVARNVNNCQNHFAHIMTMSNNSQWQSWCFCEVPNIPSNSESVNSNEYNNVYSEMNLNSDTLQRPQLDLQQQQLNMHLSDGQPLMQTYVPPSGQQVIVSHASGTQTLEEKNFN